MVCLLGLLVKYWFVPIPWERRSAASCGIGMGILSPPFWDVFEVSDGYRQGTDTYRGCLGNSQSRRSPQSDRSKIFSCQIISPNNPASRALNR